LSGTWFSLNDVPPGTPQPPYPSLTVWNNQATAPITLSDALVARKGGPRDSLLAGDPQNFDYLRHHGKINIAFCDGHVETRDIPVLQNDPAARGFMNIYLLAP
jgi:prepilin-type processing-associated H-X9-DG protein